MSGWITSPVALSIIAVALFLLNWRLQFPGTLAPDLVSQLQQARTGMLNDWHPPAMTRLWQLTLPVTAGTGLLYTLSVGMYWLGFATLALTLRRMGRPVFAVVILLAGAWPQFLALNVTVVKDALLAAGCTLGFALILDGRTRDTVSMPRVVTGVVLTLAAALLRHNAVVIVGPLLAMVFGLRPLERPWRTLIISVVTALILIPTFTIANHRLFGAADSRPVASLQLFDLAGIAARTGDLTVFGPTSRITERDVQRCYTPVMWDTLSPWGRCSWFSARADAAIVDPVKLQGEAIDHGIAKRWQAAILRHPLAYAAHRLAHWNRALFFAVPNGQTREIVINDKEDISAGRYKGSRLIYFFRNSVVVAPATAMLALAGLLTFCVIALRPVRSPMLDGALAFALAGFLYGGFFVLVGVASDIRYFQITAMSAVVSVILIASEPGARTMIGKRWRLAALVFAGVVIGMIVMLAARSFISVPAWIPPVPA